jgi:hypothetical protein
MNLSFSQTYIICDPYRWQTIERFIHLSFQIFSMIATVGSITDKVSSFKNRFEKNNHTLSGISCPLP